MITIFVFPAILFGWHVPNLGFLAWMSLVPLFVALHGTKPRQAFLLTFVTAFVYYSGSLYWLYHPMYDFGGISLFVSILATVVVVVIVAAYISLASLLSKFVENKTKVPMLVLLPAFWTVFELLRNYVPCNGFPWANLAMSQYEYLPVIQIVDVVGIFGLIFVIIWINQFIADCILKFTKENAEKLLPKIIVTAIILVIIFAYGFWRIGDINAKIGGLKPIKIALLQGNIEQAVKLGKTQKKEVHEVYRDMLAQAEKANVYLVVWPESALPWSVRRDVAKFKPDILGAVGLDAEFPYNLVGANTYDFEKLLEKHEKVIFNSAILAKRDGTVAGIYDKTHLAPFGEYVPYKKILFFIDKFIPGGVDFSTGSTSEPLAVGPYRFGNLICYEDIFPQIARKEARLGAEFFVNITNNAWFGVSSAPYQQMAMSVFRAVENRRFLLRSTNSGVSAVVEPTGRVNLKSELFTKAMLVTNIGAGSIDSTYTRLGDWFAYACVAYVVFLLVRILSVKRRSKCE